MREMPKYLPDDQRRHLGENRPQPDGDANDPVTMRRCAVHLRTDLTDHLEAGEA